MYELLTQILILVGIFFLIRFIFWTLIPRPYLGGFGIVVLLFIMMLVFFSPDNRTAGLLWGILSFPLRPLGLSLILLGYALRWGTGKISIARPQILAAFLILLITSLPLTAYLLTAQTEQRSALELSQRPVTSDVQAIVVLGDGTLPTDPVHRIRTQLSNAANGLSVTLESRLTFAAQLYSAQTCATNCPVIIVSAGPQALLAQPGVTATDAINAYLGRLGVPAEQIIVDTEGFDPRSSALAVRRILLGETGLDCSIFAICDDGRTENLTQRRDLSIVPVVLVAPAILIRRATSTFIQLGFNVVTRPTDFFVFQIQGGLRWAALTDLIPNAEALAITTRVIDEYFAWIYYFVRGWLSDPLSV
ncbi:YdcF family protein [Egbenema bharatensis]|uniref:YdcF family protein n=1 Tax=Egbenema bharatensis TaxID=3463334 RepID=UPI003A83BE26